MKKSVTVALIQDEGRPNYIASELLRYTSEHADLFDVGLIIYLRPEGKKDHPVVPIC